MRNSSSRETLRQLSTLFRTWFSTDDIKLEINPQMRIDSFPEFIIRVRGLTLIGELCSRGDTATVSSILERFERFDLPQKKHPLLVAPYMGEVGARLCSDANVSWVDLSGNAHIKTDSIYVHVEGKPNQFIAPGRPSNAFAPKSSRVSRFLLEHPHEYFAQNTLAEAIDLGDGYVSKIVRRLEEMRLLERKSDRRIGVRDPDLMLDAWWESYDFSKHRIIRGTVAAKNSHELLERLVSPLAELDGKFAATGLAAAWLMTRFASFRTTTFFVEHPPTEDWKRNVGLREDPKGANLWLVVPNDIGVFQGSREVDGIRCVHPVQAYLDLKGHPERAEEAAESIRHELLTWKQNA